MKELFPAFWKSFLIVIPTIKWKKIVISIFLFVIIFSIMVVDFVRTITLILLGTVLLSATW